MEVVFSRLDGSVISNRPHKVAYIAEADKVTVDCPDVALWRLSYDLEAEEVVVQYEGMTETEAEAQSHADLESEYQAWIDSLETEVE